MSPAWVTSLTSTVASTGTGGDRTTAVWGSRTVTSTWVPPNQKEAPSCAKPAPVTVTSVPPARGARSGTRASMR